jgi:hypothetical protein
MINVGDNCDVANMIHVTGLPGGVMCLFSAKRQVGYSIIAIFALFRCPSSEGQGCADDPLHAYWMRLP